MEAALPPDVGSRSAAPAPAGVSLGKQQVEAAKQMHEAAELVNNHTIDADEYWRRLGAITSGAPAVAVSERPPQVAPEGPSGTGRA